MRTDIRQPTLSRRQAGFSLIELLIVVLIIMITSAVALPGALRYMRNYRVRSAAQQVASEIQSARARAIMRNVNRGVVFGIVDQDTYRMLVEDPPSSAVDANGDGWPDENEGRLLDLPTGVQFVGAAATAAAMRFDRMGRWCEPSAGRCPAAPAIPCGPADRCDDNPGNYITNDATGALVAILDPSTGVGYQVAVTPGGRVRVKDLGDVSTDR